MIRKTLEDVKFNTRKSIKITKKDIISDDSGNHNPTSKNEHSNDEDSSKYNFLKKKENTPVYSRQRISQTPQMPKKARILNNNILWSFIIAVIIGIIYLLSTVFLTAKITIVTKNKTFDVKHQKFTASKTNIPFELMVVSDREFKNVVLSNSMEVNNKARGEIILYNEYSTKAQKIVAGSFLSDESGKTYKTDTTVSIPAYKLDNSKKIIPGEISVGVTAFLPGEAYNCNPVSFFINSFKGTDKYKKIYGKAKTPIEGGMTGLVYLLESKEKEDLSLKNENLKDKLLRKLSAQVPEGYILYPDSVNFSYDFNGDKVVSKTPDTKIEMNGTLSAFLIKESDLSDSIINNLLPSISLKEKSEILKPDLSSLSFNFTDINQSINKDTENFNFELTGSLLLKWKPSVDELKSILLGKNKNEIYSIFKQDPGISSADLKIIPFWSKKLPKDIENINITLK